MLKLEDWAFNVYSASAALAMETALAGSQYGTSLLNAVSDQAEIVFDEEFGYQISPDWIEAAFPDDVINIIEETVQYMSDFILDRMLEVL